jgi:molecular chaperone DnaK
VLGAATRLIETPGVSGEERRRSPRVPLNLLIQFRFDSLEEFLVDYADNISEGGMLLRSDDPRPIGSLVYLQFTLKDGTRLIEGLGKVVHSSAAGLGVEFVSFDEESTQMIQAIVAQRLGASV